MSVLKASSALALYCNVFAGAPNEHFSENEPLTTENENLDAFKAFSSAFLCHDGLCSPKKIMQIRLRVD